MFIAKCFPAYTLSWRRIIESRFVALFNLKLKNDYAYMLYFLLPSDSLDSLGLSEYFNHIAFIRDLQKG